MSRSRRSITATRVRRMTLMTMACSVVLTAGARHANAQSSPDDAACKPPAVPEGGRGLSSALTLASARERGDPLELTLRFGTSKGRPLRDLVVYVYHTDASGVYRRAPNASGCFRFHGVLHGWATPDDDGIVTVRSIRPGAYPNSPEPAHVHVVVQFPGHQGFYLNDVLFDDDPRVTPAVRAAQRLPGGAGVVTARRDARGVWLAERLVTLEPPRR